MFSTIMYNVHFGRKLSEIQEWMLLQKPFDIICLQEFPYEKINEFIKKFPTSYEYKFSVSIEKKQRKFGQLTMVNAKKMKILEAKIIPLGDARYERRILRHKAQRSALITLLSHKKKQFILANIHLTCLALNGFRRKQILKIVDGLKTYKKVNALPKILIGDFNYSSLVRQNQFIAFMKSNGFTNAYKYKTYKLFLLKHQLDYAFHHDCNITDVSLLKLPFSDHFPITLSVHV